MEPGRQVALLAVVLAAAALPAHAATVTLVYRDGNKWVAPADNAPLRTLLKAAAKGATHYRVVLPKDARGTSTDRLGILRDLLARDAKKPVLIEETNGTTKANTLKITY